MAVLLIQTTKAYLRKKTLYSVQQQKIILFLKSLKHSMLTRVYSQFSSRIDAKTFVLKLLIIFWFNLFIIYFN